MFLSVLRFIGATIVAVVLAFLIDFTAMWLFENIVYVLSCKLPWENHWFLACVLVFVCIPLIFFLCALIIAFHIVFFGAILRILVGWNNNYAIFLTLYFIIRVVWDFKIIFLDVHDKIISYIGDGFWYYCGSVITFVGILFVYNRILHAVYDNIPISKFK